MLGMTLPFILFLLYFFSKKVDTKQCLLMWSVIFSYDFIIGNMFYSNYGYFLFAALIDTLLIISSYLVIDKIKKFILFVVLGVSLFLNLQEHFSYYQTWAYEFLRVYQWVSVEILIVILMREKQNVKVCRDNY